MFFRDFYKKILTVILTVCLLSASVSIPVHADNNDFDNYIYINDIKVSPYVHLKVFNDYVYISAREFLEALGMWVISPPDDPVLDAGGHSMYLCMMQGSTGLMINGVRFEMYAPAYVENGRLYAPFLDLLRLLGIDYSMNYGLLKIYGVPVLHPQANTYLSDKVLKTGFMQDNYAKFTINGNLLDIEFASPPFGPNGRVYFDHVYGNAADSKGQKLIMTDWQGTAKEMTEESYVNFYASPVKMTIQLKNVPYNVVNISKMVQNRDGSYSGKYVYYYDYFIKNSDGEFSFAFPRPYFDNVHMLVQLKSPNSYLDIKLYDPGAYHGLKVLSDSICEGATTDYEKVRKIHDWMVTYLYYDIDGTYGERKTVLTQSIDVILARKTNCAGFSRLFRDLLRFQNIPCTIVSGNTRHNIFEDYTPSHAWNMVYLDGVWKNFDITWNNRNRYENGVFIKNPPEYGYFDIDPFYFSYDHHITELETYE